MFEIKIDSGKKVFYAFAEGFFNMDEAKKFEQEFLAKAKSVNTSEYSLLINTKDLKPSSPEVADNMSNIIKMYLETPFKKRIALKVEFVLAQMQIERIGKAIPNFNLIKFVKDEKEAYSLI
ncbi:hypothetical protein [Clostridium polynesiense]|uniref:hypothetical protein n=1 Tax=Clostridium polynesiense TaxID=1325933 RepID=UPI00058E9CF4|nr:hypothetical protein [Clostridium polynesiense]